MQHIQGGDRNQTLLLPVAVDDYVGRENPVRFIEAFVDQCDLQEAGFRRVQPNDTGRPGYDPADLLKLYIYPKTGSCSVNMDIGGECYSRFAGGIRRATRSGAVRADGRLGT
jgi:transposase